MSERIDVHACEVGMRDGLQYVRAFMPTAENLARLKADAAVGTPEIEVCSFAPHKLIPQFVDAAEVCERALEIPGLAVTALIPQHEISSGNIGRCSRWTCAPPSASRSRPITG